MVLAQDVLLSANSFVLLALAALLVDCRFPCVWTNLTTIFPEDKSRSVPLTVAKPHGSCYWTMPREFSKIVFSRNFPVCYAATNFSSSTTRASSRPLVRRRAGVHSQSPSRATKSEHLTGKVEVFLTRELDSETWEALVRPGRKMQVGSGFFSARVNWKAKFSRAVSLACARFVSYLTIGAASASISNGSSHSTSAVHRTRR